MFAASQILYKSINDKTLAVINCCEHEFSIASDEHGGSNPLNPIQQYNAIIEARKHADYVLVIVHGGHEMWQLPSPRMVEIYHFFIDAGADAVVNHHQHCFSGYETYKSKPIFYGLGNFCFENKGFYEGLWEYGYMVNIHFCANIEYELIPYEQCKNRPAVVLRKDRSAFEKEVRLLNEIIADKKRLKDETEKII